MKILFVYEDYQREYTAIHNSLIDGFPSDYTIEKLKYSFYISPKIFNKIAYKIPLMRDFLYALYGKKLLILLSKNDFDYLFVIKGNFLLADTLKKVRASFPNLKIINYNPDSPFNTASSNENVSKSVALFNLYCVYSRSLQKKINDLGIQNAFYTPFAVDKKRIYKVDSPGYDYNISFIGNGDIDRENKIEDLFSGSQEKVYLFGNNWKQDSYKTIHPAVSGTQLLKTISISKINLNVLRKQNEGSTNMRTFEIPAAGGFMFHEYSEEAMEYFIPDVDAVYYKSSQEFRDKLTYYLKNSVKREKIRIKGYEKSQLKDFQYSNRIQKILKTFSA